MTIIPQEASRLFCVGEVTVNYKTDQSQNRERIQTTADAFNCFRQYWTEDIERIEEFYVMCLNAANDVVGIYKVSTGNQNATIADPRIVFQVAIGTNASFILLAHNHPSGNLEASQGDKELTALYKQLGVLMNCKLLDHLILGPQPHAYFSFADEGIL